MKRRYWVLFGVLTLVSFMFFFAKGLAQPSPPAGIVAEQLEVPDPGYPSLPVAIWRPQARSNSKLPLVVISHGAGGSKADHLDTAVALAQAGFVVAAVEHTGDNYRDTSGVARLTQLSDRPRHIMKTLDYLTGQWNGRKQIDPDRIGMFGFSAGAFTALVLAGATPDLSRGARYCRKRPSAWTCRYLRKNGVDPGRLAKRAPVEWVSDPRIKAAAIAAPAIGYSFADQSAEKITVPLHVWSAQNDHVVEDSPAQILRVLPSKTEKTVVSHAGHFSFMAPCNWQKSLLIGTLHRVGNTEPICTDAPSFDRVAFHVRFNSAIVAFFKTQLNAPPVPPSAEPNSSPRRRPGSS